MQYNHIILDICTDGKANRDYLLSLDISGEEVKRIADSLRRNETFFISGMKIDSSDVNGIHIFRSNQPAEELVLPNKRSLAEYKDSECMPVGCCKHRYIGKCLIQGKVRDTVNCTEQFISASPKRTNRRKKNNK